VMYVKASIGREIRKSAGLSREINERSFRSVS
jgi:hypothetical protein